MTKLNKEELLDVFDGVFSFYLGELGHKEDKPRIRQAQKQIVALIQKPGVTEEWIEEKAVDLMDIVDNPHMVLGRKILKVQDFIRSLVEECTRFMNKSNG